MIELDDFRPRWVSPPSDTIADILRAKGLSLSGFAQAMGTSRSTAEAITSGKIAIDETLASQLSAVLGLSTRFWMAREIQYRQEIRRVASAQEAHEWLAQLPLKDMVKYGWISASRNTNDKLNACLAFFGVDSIDAWQEKYRGELSVAAFRKSSRVRSNPASLAAWLRWAELQSESISCEPWDPQKFRESLANLRKLTRRKDPSEFLPELRRTCAACGVAVVVAQTPAGCPASGATRFIRPDKALIVLSFRYRTDDQFWFTFFHEAGHLLLHSREALFLEDDSDASFHEEAEANEFSAHLLIPPQFWPVLERLQPNMREVIRFAHQLGISPGIVVGQLQHRRKIGPERLNYLKRRYRWSTNGEITL